MYFKELAGLIDDIDGITSRIEVRDHLRLIFNKLEPSEIEQFVRLLTGNIYLAFEGIELNIGANILEQVIAQSYGYEKEIVAKKHLELGDLGLVAEYFSDCRKQQSLFTKSLSLGEVYNLLRDLSELAGKSSQGSKSKILSALLKNSSGTEAKYIIKMILGTMRMKMGIQTIIESLSLDVIKKSGIDDYKDDMPLFKTTKEFIEQKYNISGDLGLIAQKIITLGKPSLNDIVITPGVPIRSALAEREKNAEAIIRRLGRCIVEAKYDGLRLQLHHYSGVTKMYSRRSEDLTKMFPEIVSALKDIKIDFIIDSEAIGYDHNTNKYLSFQETITRKRKYGIKENSDKVPILIHAFDVLYYDKDVSGLPLAERRIILEKLLTNLNLLNIKKTSAIYTDKAEDLMAFFNSNLSNGLEGIIAKDLSKPYVPGGRNFAWIKLKKNYLKGMADSIDLVIMGYFLGKGKNANRPAALLCGIYNKENNDYQVVAKVGSGLTEEQMDLFKKEFKEIESNEKPDNYLSAIAPYKYIDARFVIEVVADEITRSPLYKDMNEGFSLRFPRFIKVREDKSLIDTTTEKELKRMFELQKS